MGRPRERRILVYFGQGFAFLEHFLETEQVPVDALAVCCPGGVLQVPSHGPAEECRALLVLLMAMTAAIASYYIMSTRL